jgi:LysM repeat protein
MKQYKLANDIAGWLVFLVALITYTLTLEATTSFWDCGEFISGAYKLQVVHPPGAPMFLLLGRLATMFAFDDPNWIAWTVNFLSGLTSAFSVLFLFWITTHFARKIVAGANVPTTMQTIAIIATGAIAGLACTFTDTIWFSAVEGEVYAMSLFFMMLVFWTMLKWESCEDDQYRDKWLVLTFFLLGVSSGVHLLSFLAIPPMALIYYFKEYKNPKPLGIFVSLVIGFVILGFFFKGIVSGLISIIASFELFAVNSLGLGVGIGFGIFVLILAALIVGGLYATKEGNAAGRLIGGMSRTKLHVAMLCFLMTMIGFSTYTIVVIRAGADTPINMNNPDNVFMLESYLNREQYGSRALVYGPNYTAYPTEIEDKGNRYFPIEDKKTGKVTYEIIGKKVDYKFDKKDMMFMPRMGSWNDDRHVMAYRAMLNPDFAVVDRQSGQTVKEFSSEKQGWQSAYQQAQNFAQSSSTGSLVVKDLISQRDNMSFFFRYQVGVMYLRYFFWNFTGRQNDIQGRFDNNEGKAITGIGFIDNSIVGPSENLPEWRKDNAGMNKYFILPFLLGLIGMYYHAKRDWKGFSIILVLFLFTGVLQVIYLNSPPFEPRERDYTLVGSFVTFCLWIGFGMLAIYKALENGKLNSKLALSLSFAVSLSVPLVLVSQNWDDHDRSGRYTARDFAINYLESCAPNAIIFTQGDNDTYPLWYAQEVENIRPDIRVVNLSLLGVDWYVQQLEYKMNEAPAVKLSLTPEKYRGNTRDVVRFYDTGKFDQKSYYPLADVIGYIANDGNKLRTQGGEMVEVFPVKNFYLPVDKEKVVANGIVPAEYYDRIADQLRWSLGDKSNLLKNDLVTLDIVASNLWERPIYFAVSVSPDAYLGLDKYFQLEGLAYRIVPVESANGGNGYIAQNMMYENAMTKFRWGGIERKKVIDYTLTSGETLATVAYKHNQTVAQLKAYNKLATDEVAVGTKLKIEVPQWIYLDENINRMTMNLRSNFGRLAEDLIASNKKAEAIKVLDESLKVMPEETLPYNVFMLRYPDIYYKAGAKEQAQLLMRKVLDHTMEEYAYLQDVKDFEPGYKRDSDQSIAIVSELRRIATNNQDSELVEEISEKLMQLQGMGAF